MKKLLFVLPLVTLISQMAAAQTVDDLFNKYKDKDYALYTTIPPDSLMCKDSYKGSKVFFAESLSIAEIDMEEFQNDLGALKGYEKVDLMEHATIRNELEREFLDYWIQCGLACYARRRGRVWTESLLVVPVNGIWTIVHVKGRLKDRVFRTDVNLEATLADPE